MSPKAPGRLGFRVKGLGLRVLGAFRVLRVLQVFGV